MKPVPRCDEQLWQRIKRTVQRADKGGMSGQWSAIKAFIAVKEYKKRGGKYCGSKDSKKSAPLTVWKNRNWRTKSGGRSLDTGERFLPAVVIAAMTPRMYAETSNKKRLDLLRGVQYSKQPKSARKLTSEIRKRL